MTLPSHLTPLMLACLRNDASLTTLLCPHLASLDTRTDGDRTALMLAALYGHKEALKALLDCGAQTNLVDNQKADALILACQQGHEECALLLIDRGAPIGGRTVDGITALKAARQKKLEAVVKRLIAAGAKE